MREQRAIGFTQLYPSFSSISAARLFILNDLFVSPDARRSGAGSALLRAAADFGRAANAVELELSTAMSNHGAQALYEREGWQRDQEFFVYRLRTSITVENGLATNRDENKSCELSELRDAAETG